jgi:hypothetical protein
MLPSQIDMPIAKMLACSLKSAFHPFVGSHEKRQRLVHPLHGIETLASSSNSIDPGVTSSNKNELFAPNDEETDFQVLVPPTMQSREPRPRRVRLSPLEHTDPRVEVALGSAMVVSLRRRALVKAVPALGVLDNGQNFKYLVISVDVLSNNTILTPRSLDCFAALCEAMYSENVPLKHFHEIDVAGAMFLATALRANGIMVLCNQLLNARPAPIQVV